MLRVGRRQRTNVGGPNGVEVPPQTRESEMPIVVLNPEKVKAGGAKGHYYKQRLQNEKPVGIEKQVSTKRRSKLKPVDAFQEEETGDERSGKGIFVTM